MSATTMNFVLIVKGDDVFVNEVKREIQQTSPIVSEYAEYKVGEKANFTVTFSNPSDMKVSGSLKFLVSDLCYWSEEKNCFSEFVNTCLCYFRREVFY